jgi:chemotaxis protein MotB
MARRKKHEEHENHERWLVSYADFITLLFAFFVVMYAISQVNEGKYRVLSDALVNAFQSQSRADVPVPSGTQSGRTTPGGPSHLRQTLPLRRVDPVQEAKRKKQEAKMKDIAKDILKVLEPLVKEGQVRVTQSNRGVAVEINASVLFAAGQAVLEKQSVETLTAVARVLAQVDNQLQVEGYSDNTPINTPQYPSNWELSTARASSVVRLFIENGVAPDRLTSIGYGENRPVESNDTAEGRARNRRVTVLILSDTDENVKEIPITQP